MDWPAVNGATPVGFLSKCLENLWPVNFVYANSSFLAKGGCILYPDMPHGYSSLDITIF